MDKPSADTESVSIEMISLPEATDDSDANSITEQEAPPQTNGPAEKHDLSMQQDPAENFISGWKLLATTASTTLACFLMMLDTSILGNAISQITNEFHSLTDVGWYGSAYQLACAAVQPLVGKILTYFKTKWCFLAFFALFELGSLLCGVATSSTMLIVGRAVAGLGGAGLQNGGMSIIAGCAPLHKRPLLTGVMLGVSQIAVIVGPLIGGALTQYSTWRWCFYINLPIGAVSAVCIALIHIPEQTEKPPAVTLLNRDLLRKLDFIGFLIFAPAAVQLLLALQWGGNKYAWDSAAVIGLFCGAGGAFLAFLAWNSWRGEEALIPTSMIRHGTMISCSLIVFFMMGTLQLASYFMPIYFQSVRDVSPVTSGLYFLPTVLSTIVASLLSGALGQSGSSLPIYSVRDVLTAYFAFDLVAKLGYLLPWTVVGGALNTAGNGVASLLSSSSSTGLWVGFQVLWGIGRGLGFQMPYVAVQNCLPPSQISIAISLLSFMQNLGGSIILTVGNTIFGTTLQSRLHKFAPTADAEAVRGAGASAFRSIVSSDELSGVLQAYATGVGHVYYLGAGAAAASFIACFGMGKIDVREKKAADVTV